MKRNEIYVGGVYAVTADGGFGSLNKRRVTAVKATVLETGIMREYNGSMRPVGYRVQIETHDYSTGKPNSYVKVLPAISFRSTWHDELLRIPEYYAQQEKNLAEARERQSHVDVTKDRILATVTAVDPDDIDVDQYGVTLPLAVMNTILDDLEAKDKLLDFFYSQVD